MSAPADPGARAVSGCTNFRLRKLSRRVSQHYDAHLAPAGLRATQFSLLGALMDLAAFRAVTTGRPWPGGSAPGMGAATVPPAPTLTQLADELEMDRTTLTRNLRPLIAAGWVELATGDDARKRAVRITEAGRERWRLGRPLWREAQRTLHAAFGQPQVVVLHEALDAALARMP